MGLSRDELAELRRDLESLEGEIQRSIDGSAEAVRPVELDQPTVGRVSRIDAIQQQKMLEAKKFHEKINYNRV